MVQQIIRKSEDVSTECEDLSCDSTHFADNNQNLRFCECNDLMNKVLNQYKYIY